MLFYRLRCLTLLMVSLMGTGIRACEWAPLLGLIPAAVGGYNTYKTLVADSFIGNSCENFRRALHKANPQHVSTVLRTGLINLKHFKSHEKAALVGSALAVIIGQVCTAAGFFGSLQHLYHYYSITIFGFPICVLKKIWCNELA